MFVLKRIQSTKLNVITKNIPKICVNKLSHSPNVLYKKAPNEHLKLNIHGEEFLFPYVWLRDNCQCEKCFHPSAKSRIIDWRKFDLDAKPKGVDKDENSLQVTWTDGHTSRYKLDWLKLRSFTQCYQNKFDESIYKPKKITWHGSDFNDIFSKHDFNDILNSDEALYNWLYKLSVYGVALIQNTPNSETALDAVAEKIGFTKRTHYGEKFIVQHVPNTSNVAYLPNNLQMHTDLPYYQYGPGVNLLHCLVQTAGKGGENLLSDCHYVANYMKKNLPEQFKLLTETEVEWNDVGTEHGKQFLKIHRCPIIALDKHGDITRISFSVAQRSSHFPVPIDTVVPWYEAHSIFLDLNHKFAAKFKSQEGSILVFDNIRLLHGRNGYIDSQNNVRKLIGGYIDWDEIYSRLRCLKVKLKNPTGVL